ncbi:peptidase [Streptomyces sp. WM6373]|uniref:leishmanolysin-related zinc metalloendopeptidase n=1 Tax=Streptomyces TaxID=1883 RepID=UPI0006AF81D5|nr:MULTISPECIES: leishmanolysin-related zinc metalloendopeptidase [unclassified Streptomyces]KOU34829.1 peptidase [Streptomyces sp. WM6373]KOU66736.1 peptidase [Streptomyces sp. IGB124]KOU75512.1 peptidase [Streptomyces sp. XY66]KOV19730.1 peptidase [Streptomyces sp. XY413]KOV37641.1 peptidase [Streptomyces sp. H021]
MARNPTFTFESYRAVASATRAADLAETSSPFQIEVRFIAGLSNSQKDVFAEAAERWARVIVGDLETAIIRDFSGEVVVDDILIDAEGVFLDGVFGVLGEAGPRIFRPQTALAGAGLPAKAVMRFDKADLGQMEDDGSLLDVITHEMGHCLGIGAFVWSAFGLLKDWPPVLAPGNPTFVGPGAMAEFGILRGAGQPLPVPVANVGGTGSAGSHWRETVFGNELMSPTIAAAGNPLSRLTAASLGDIGYEVDLDGAEPYELPDLMGIAAAGEGPPEPPRGVVLPTVPSSIPSERP